MFLKYFVLIRSQNALQLYIHVNLLKAFSLVVTGTQNSQFNDTWYPVLARTFLHDSKNVTGISLTLCVEDPFEKIQSDLGYSDAQALSKYKINMQEICTCN